MSNGLSSGAFGLSLGAGLYAGNPGLWGGAAGLDTGLQPSLYLDLLAGAPLDSRVTFTRATTATFIGSNGLIQIAAINAPRFDYDPVTLAAKGLLTEEQRTNFLLNSLIDGTSLTTQTVTVAAVAHTLSFYGTGTVTLSGVATASVIGTGVYPNRQTLTFTPTAGSLICTVTGSVQYAQLETGTFATSYIPTGESQVTRTVDVPSMTGTNFSSWYNQSEGTFLSSVLAGPVSLIDAQTAIYVVNEATTNVIFVRRNTALNVASLLQTSGGAGAGLIPVAPAASNVVYKNATAYALNNARSATNGTLSGLDTAVSAPPVDRLFIGVNSSGTLVCNGHIRQIAYYNTRLSDAQLQALTV